MPRTYPAVTVVDVAMKDLVDIWLLKNADGDIEAEFGYEVRQDNDELHHTGDLRKVLTPTEVQALKQWLDTHILPLINAQEGM